MLNYAEIKRYYTESDYAERVHKENALLQFGFLCDKVAELPSEKIQKICSFIEDEIELSNVNLQGVISDE